MHIHTAAVKSARREAAYNLIKLAVS
jgi:hypothetical protein